MTTHDHCFVLTTPALSIEDLCLDCLNPWSDCTCEDKPTFDEAKLNYETERSPH